MWEKRKFLLYKDYTYYNILSMHVLKTCTCQGCRHRVQRVPLPFPIEKHSFPPLYKIKKKMNVEHGSRNCRVNQDN